MNGKVFVIGFLLVIVLTLNLVGQDGAILEKESFVFSKETAELIAHEGSEYFYLNNIDVHEITYSSDGLKVKGFLLEPKEEGKYPCVIFNRGGTGELGAINESMILRFLAPISSWGYVVVAS